MRSNVVKFPRPKRALPDFKFDTSRLKAAMPKVSTVKGVLGWLWAVVRLAIFLVMYWLRLPVIFLCNLISVPMLVLWLFALYAFPDKGAMIWGFGSLSFSAFLIAWIYDFILMAISPQDMMRTF